MNTLWEQRYAQRTQRMSSSTIRELLKLAEQRQVISFAGGLPAAESFPLPELEEAMHRILARMGSSLAPDGTMIPLSFVYPRGLRRDGSHPALLEGYGAYGISLDPFFRPALLAWLERGGVYAVAHVRGGGEFGEEWHLAGKLATKPNTWRDFIACAEFLVKQGYTSPAHLAGTGTSAGGILIGRAITERPDLFRAAVPQVGAVNALRTEHEPGGPANIPEFGTTADSAGFLALKEMDALIHLKRGTRYPATLFTAGIFDSRVEPWQPGKMVAAMQAQGNDQRPVLFRVDFDAGHGMGLTKSQRSAQLADVYGFLLWQLGAPAFQLAP